MGGVVDGSEEVLEVLQRWKNPYNVDMDVSKAASVLLEGTDAHFGVAVDFRPLASQASSRPILRAPRDGIPDKLLLH